MTAINKYCHDIQASLPHITMQTILNTSGTTITLTSHKSNPLECMQSGEWLIVREGIETTETDILVNSLNDISQVPLTKQILREWREKLFNSYQLAFFIVAFNKITGCLIFANDDLARLPVYLYHNEKTLIISREFTLVRHLIQNIQPDRLISALYLMFVYAPGYGTPYKEIDTLGCSTVGCYNSQSGTLIMSSDPACRLPAANYRGSKKSFLRDLASSFLVSNQQCLNHREAVLGLSGGYDSRAVAVALLLNNENFRSVTYKDTDDTASKDIDSSWKLAQFLKLKHSIITLIP